MRKVTAWTLYPWSLLYKRCWSFVWKTLKSIFYPDQGSSRMDKNKMHMLTPWTIYYWSFKSVVLTVSELHVRVMQTFQDRWKYRWNNEGRTHIQRQTYMYIPLFLKVGHNILVTICSITICYVNAGRLIRAWIFFHRWKSASITFHSFLQMWKALI